MATMSKEDLLEVFKNMTVLELNEFLKAFEEEFGVTAAAPVVVAAAGGGAAAPEAAEEQDEFDVVLLAGEHTRKLHLLDGAGHARGGLGGLGRRRLVVGLDGQLQQHAAV